MYYYFIVPQCKHAPIVYAAKSTLKVKKGKSATLTCIVRTKEACSLISAMFYWRNPQGRVVIKNTKRVESRLGGVRMTLAIKHTMKNQAGAYKCITRNARTKKFSSVRLNVE